MASYPASVNIAVVKEFYANARYYGDEDMAYTSYVSDNRIPYDADTINTFLGVEWSRESSHCQFSSLLEEDLDFTEVERILCIQGVIFRETGKMCLFIS